MLFGVLDGFHRGVWHRLARLAAYQVGGEHQRRGAGDHRFRNAFRAQLVHVTRADGEGALAAVADQGKTAANGAVDALQIVQIGAAGGIAQVTIGIAADFDIAAHHAKQHRAIVRQHRVVMHGIADGAAGKLMGNEIIAYQLLVQRLGDVIFNHQRVARAQTIAHDKRLIHFRFDIHQRLVDTDHPGDAGFILRLNLLQQRIAGVNGKIVFRFAFTGKFHSGA